ncbi:MAG: FAD-dependent oxidoreductase [Flavobacteriales bacterium]|nr:FAD-dependent oxidoreductase [Flavobacteriales bacterium]
MNVDFIIVGQGIAGTCFAFELIKNQKSFIIIDKVEDNSSSKVALGVYNPLVLKWFTKVWKADEQISYFYKFYNEIEHFLKHNFIENEGIYKYLKTVYAQNMWLSKSPSKHKFDYMSQKILTINKEGLINTNFYGLVKKAGRIDIPLLLRLFKNHYVDKKILIEEDFNYEKLVFEHEGLYYNNIFSKNIIFCEGVKLFHNPYFKYLNLKPTKGEILAIYCKGLSLKNILHSRFLLIPLGNDYYSVGATYDWNNLDNLCTAEAKAEIKSMLDQTLKLPYKIISQRSGIRPSTFDRRAIVGRHNQYKNMYILNGLGTRGVLLSPYLSKCLVDYIYYNGVIDSDVDVKRFEKK